MKRSHRWINALNLSYVALMVAVAWGNDLWPIATFLGGLPILLAIVVALALAVWAMIARVKKAALWLAVPLTMIAWCLWPSPLAPLDPSQPSLKVLTWNMEDARGDEEAKFRWIASTQADVIALQETALDSGVSLHPRIARALPGYSFFGSADRGVYVRGTVLRDLSQRANIRHHRRDVPMAVVKTSLGKMVIGTIHLVHGMDPRWILRRQNVSQRLTLGQSQREAQIDAAMRSIGSESASSLLCGDFNMQPFGAQNRFLSEHFFDAGRSHEFEGTWKDALNLYRLDRVWASHDLVPVQRSTHRRPDSDHHAVIVTFQRRK